ncbi:ABC transporter G family member 22 [Symbiodinium microadriaticum]|uniref:ABC transporter G family member 22 n=1 Tax=Symbiodinium microadriaticum TaxID=2951 RepID=A0A1Q9C372_SYMMI|nr:ABC transporter G family member 22 [Symbiodinium microadriaticum]
MTPSFAPVTKRAAPLISVLWLGLPTAFLFGFHLSYQVFVLHADELLASLGLGLLGLEAFLFGLYGSIVANDATVVVEYSSLASWHQFMAPTRKGGLCHLSMRVAPSDLFEDVNDEDFENLPMSVALGKESMVPMAVRGSSTTIKSKFTWHDVGMTVGADKQEKQILTSISGTLETGELCALMGPSGAGKTSLLNVLAGRTRTNRRQRITGSILLDGQAVTGAGLRKRIAYVMQQDILCPTQTVREALMFSANLRLPRSFSAKVEDCSFLR